MKALIYHGPGKKLWESKEDPKVERATDAIVKIDTTTICGTDLHILKGDVPAVTDGRTLGHEGSVQLSKPDLRWTTSRKGIRFLSRASPLAGGVPTAGRGCTAIASTEEDGS